jgi:hypothetical protein
MNNKTQVGGDHYDKMVISPIDYIEANEMKFAEGNVIKYISRFESKNGVEDLYKARQYLSFVIEREEAKLGEKEND